MNVVLQGEPGVGKTFLLHHIALLWAINDRTMDSFDVVILVQLKDILKMDCTRRFEFMFVLQLLNR